MSESASTDRVQGPKADRLLLFGGPYSNLPALEALRSLAEEAGFGPDAVFCTGDVVAYAAEPEACVRLLRDWGCTVIMGNCEESLALDADDCGCGFEEGTACNALSANWFRYSRKHISAGSRAWMASLPRQLRMDWQGFRLGFCHGSPERINEFVFHSTPADRKTHWLADLGVDVMVGGHSGLPFIQPLPNGLWLNAGAIGMPANDGSPDTWFATLLKTGNDSLEAALHRLSYDWRSTQERMQAAGLPAGYANALETGLWPSEEVLPEHERHLRGLPIQITRLVFSR